LSGAPRRLADFPSLMRVLGLDHGGARCGCAISDPSGTVVRPLPAIDPPFAPKVARLTAEHEVERVVVGLPISLGGGEGEQARASRAFAAELEDLLEIPVDSYDERLTTKLAERSSREGAEADPDSLAAAHLLESYLASRGNRP
jgi:putative Holliday junction resolvase